MIETLKTQWPSVARWLGNMLAGYLGFTGTEAEKVVGFVLFAGTLVWTAWENKSHAPALAVGKEVIAAEAKPPAPPATPPLTRAWAFALIPAALLIGGCAGILAGSDPIVVRAEQIEKASMVSFDTFVRVEYLNRPRLLSVSPEFLKQADRVRLNATNWVSALDATILAYKHNRAESNKVTLATALATLSTALSQTESLLAQAVTNIATAIPVLTPIGH